MNVVFSLAKIERKNERLRGKMPEEEKAALKEELRRLKERLDNEKAVKRNVDSLLYKLEVSLSRCRYEIKTSSVSKRFSKLLLGLLTLSSAKL